MDMKDLKLDGAILSAIPVKGQVVSISRHGDTNWSTGFKITIDADGVTHHFFVKILERIEANEMARGEFESMKTLNEIVPNSLAPPIAWGNFDTHPSKAFYLTYFRHLDKSHPASEDLVDIVRRIHQVQSPTGKFGFHVPTFYGSHKVDNSWCDTWEGFFTREMKSALAYSQDMLNHDSELEELAVELFDKVVPRLLRPLETGGRKIKPVLVFGDLWDANIQMDLQRKTVALFDPCCLYGHFEYDFQCMRSDRYRFNHKFISDYLKRESPSDPKDEFDDRNALYAIRNDLHTMGMRPENSTLLEHTKSEMKRLLMKYPDGIANLGHEHV